MQKQIFKFLFLGGGTLTIIGAASQLFELKYAPYLFSIGAAILIFLQIKIALDSNTPKMRQQRIGRNGFLASLLLAAAAYFMFTDSNLWVVAVLIYALTSFFLSFRGN